MEQKSQNPFIQEVFLKDLDILSVDKFRKMDYLGVNQFNLPIELMMEHAGLQLARLITYYCRKDQRILVGVGKGNNGGGGLVASRRLAAWGFEVFVHLPDHNLNPLAKTQWERAKAFGVREKWVEDASVFIDAYFGFSQRLPLPEIYTQALHQMQKTNALKISLDLPSTFNLQNGKMSFVPDHILTMAMMKEELLPFINKIEIWIADIGIPSKVYESFGVKIPEEFKNAALIRLKE